MRTDLLRVKRDLSFSSSRVGVGETTVQNRYYSHTRRKILFFVAFLIGLSIIASVLILKRKMRGPEQAQTPGIKTSSIAVLPFEDLSALKDQEYFADGLAEDLLND